jgi:hypothetical protein
MRATLVTHNQHLDDPAVRREDDAFNRWPFSERLADTIANFDAAAGAPVIGIYGKWGSGKTSVLNFLQSALAEKHGEKVVLHPFNPWLFKDPVTLLQSFFAELGKAMQKSSKTLGENVGQLLQNYSGLFGLIPGVGSAMGKIAEQGGKALTRSMEEVRDQVCEMMKTAEKKVVVLIDDLDRLDRDEVLQMLKLVRLTANFPNVVYLLAFDDEMVSRAIAQKYGSGDGDDAGRQFLEKIVQYPFTLPAVSQQRLMAFVQEQARSACEQAGIALDKPNWVRFQELARNCLARRLATPRQAIRYGNALRFALPMMKGEVNVLDQMALEGMRVLYPTLYAVVRDNKETFTHPFEGDDYPDFDDPMGVHQRWIPAGTEEVKRRIVSAMTGADADETTSAEKLVDFLFARSNPQGPQEQGVARARYFDRYFSYGLAADEIGDVEIDTLTARQAEQEKTALLVRLIARNADQLLRLLSVRLPLFDLATAIAVARLIVANGARFVEVDGLDPRRVAFLVAHLVLHARKIEEYSGPEPDNVHTELVKAGSQLPLELAIDLEDQFDLAIQRPKKQSDELPVYHEEHRYTPQQNMLDHLRAVLRGRLEAQAVADWRSMMVQRSNGRVLLRDWNSYDADAQRTWLAGLLAEHPDAVGSFLRACEDATSSLSFNKDLIRSMTDMERLIETASRAAAGANERRDVKVIEAFLAWAKTLRK